ncbi:MAG: NYN domain-containing protein [Beijerinckiaceae bacterium]|jgi:uncharacterized LabA/DUF88 family protein
MAVLVDGGFFLKRLKSQYPSVDAGDAKAVAQIIHQHALRHRNQITGADSAGKIVETYDLYRIFFYDCAPLEKKMQHPISKKSIDFAKSPIALFRRSLHDELKRKRKVALRMGHLLDTTEWKLKPGVLKALTGGRRRLEDLTDEDFSIDTLQKGVDMRLGLDVASLAYKKLVDQIVLIVGDSDFVPAAKLARREGIDVILDRLGTNVHDALNEHIDGVRTFKGNNHAPHGPHQIVQQDTIAIVAQRTTVMQDDDTIDQE